jgi:hypothetical protein
LGLGATGMHFWTVSQSRYCTRAPTHPVSQCFLREICQQQIPTTYAEKFVQHITNYIIRLEYMHKMSKAGGDKRTITDALRSMHGPLA